MTLPSPAREKKIVRRMHRAVLRSDWWKTREAEVRHCRHCGGKLVRRFVPAEKRLRALCRDCGTISYRNPTVVAGTLPVRDGKIYLLRRDIEPARGLWTFPAGYMELGENAEEAAARETREEIRARVKILGLYGVYSHGDSTVVTVVYLARVVGPEPRKGEEAQCVQGFRPGEIPWEELAFHSTLQALKSWVSGH